jgi:hypothetical protein
MATLTMRDRTVIERQLDLALARLTDIDEETMPHSVTRTRGVAEALEWVLGVSDTAPITSTFAPSPNAPQVLAEQQAAEDVLYSRREDWRERAWIGGVEHALLWACDRTSRAPISDPGGV